METEIKIIGYKDAPWNRFTLDNGQIPIYQLVCAKCEKPVKSPFPKCCEPPTEGNQK